ncbi:MAG: hypothetical protein ACKV2Q_27375 [Planctomycetaceae bacterium]
MRRRLARPFGHTVPPTRILSLLFGMAVLAMFYQRVKEPQFWRWLTNESRADVADVADAPTKPAPPADAAKPKGKGTNSQETIVPGPNETDPDELAKLRSHFKSIQDRKPLQPYEMPAYWRLMAWSRTRPLAELEKGALRDVPYSHLWEEPDLYRGQPMRLRLHVRRVLAYDTKDNPLGLKKVFEVYGFTDNSLSLPFIVVLPEKPAGLPIGTDVYGEIVFVGYFMKWMSYQAFDTKKSAPLLVGRARPAVRSAATGSSGGWESAFLMLVGGVIGLSLLGWFSLRAQRRPRSALAVANVVAPDRLPDNWMSNPVADAHTESADPTDPSLGSQ